MSKETSSTIGEQRKFNYALKPMAKDEFVRLMTTDLAEAPAYFPKDAEINRTGATALGELEAPAALSPQMVKKLGEENHIILDVRPAAEFGAGHVPGSINIGLGGQFAIWAGSLIPLSAPIVIVAASAEKVEEAQTRLARVGIENVKGYLADGVQSWSDAGFGLATVPQISVDELRELMQEQRDLQILDVRRSTEYQSGHVPGAQTSPLQGLEKSVATLPLDSSRQLAVICAGGYRSSAATSILLQHGFSNLLNVSGGTGAWINAGYPVEIPPKESES